MPVYLYFCDLHGEFEETHSMNEKLETCPYCVSEEIYPPRKVKRLISGGTTFVLQGGGWADSGYSSK